MSRTARLTCVLLSLSLLSACGRSDPDVMHSFYFDPPNERMGTDRWEMWVSHQYIARLTPEGFDTSDLIHYRGEPVSYKNNAWNPGDRLIYTYKSNYKPSETWLMSVSVPKLKLAAVTRIPDKPRGGGVSPLFAFDPGRKQLVVADAQRPCGSRFVNIWYVYDSGAQTWSRNSLDDYAFTTLDYDPVEDNFVGVGMNADKGRVVVRLDHDGNMLSQVEANLCDAMEPRIHGFEQIHYQSQIVDGAVHIYRLVYYGKHAQNDVFWERQFYRVDIASGEVVRN